MKKLPEAARAIIERARESHDPSEAQLQNLLASLHAELGYSAAPSEPDAAPLVAERARGVLHAKLLKLALTFAALGAVVALMLAHLMLASPGEERAAVLMEQQPVAAAPSELPSAAAEAQTSEGSLQVQAERAQQAERPTGVRARRVQEKSERRTAKPRSPEIPQPSVSAQQAQREQVTGAGVAEPMPVDHAYAPPEPAQKVQLSADVVPVQTARKRVQERAHAASDADELQLMDRAASLLRDGEPERAIELLQEHGRRFPASQMKLERRGLNVLARCGAGQLEQGRRERDEFLREAGNAPIAARVRRACRELQP